MNNYFDFKRFWQYFKLNWWMQYSLSYILLAVFLLLATLLYIYNANSGMMGIFVEAPFCVAALGLLLLGWIHASLSFTELGKIGSTIRFLQIPVTHTEKWLVKVLMAFVVFPFLVLVSIQCLTLLFGLISPMLFATRFHPIGWGSLHMQTVFYIYYLFLPLAFCAGLFWKKYGALKTLGCVLAVFVVLVTLLRLIGVPEVGYSFLELSLAHQGGNPPAEMAALVRRFWLCAAIVPSVLMFLASYFLIKEREL